jgi:hypothetical protein
VKPIAGEVDRRAIQPEDLAEPSRDALEYIGDCGNGRQLLEEIDDDQQLIALTGKLVNSPPEIVQGGEITTSGSRDWTQGRHITLWTREPPSRQSRAKGDARHIDVGDAGDEV